MIQDQSCADLDPDSPEHSNLWHSHTCNKITKKGLWSPPPPANTITPWTLPQKNFFFGSAHDHLSCVLGFTDTLPSFSSTSIPSSSIMADLLQTPWILRSDNSFWFSALFSHRLWMARIAHWEISASLVKWHFCFV